MCQEERQKKSKNFCFSEDQIWGIYRNEVRMIAYIEGKLAAICEGSCIVVTSGGIGYEIFLPTHTLAGLPATGESLSLYLVHIVREDAQELYGFGTWDERLTFKILLMISKVGARTALAILSKFRPDDLRRLVIEENALALSKVPGIGNKTAQHIFLELKDKLKSGKTSSAGGMPGTLYSDAMNALLTLGYNEEEAGTALKAVLQGNPDLDLSSTLRATLQSLAKVR